MDKQQEIDYIWNWWNFERWFEDLWECGTPSSASKAFDMLDRDVAYMRRKSKKG
jgi:hypothetical protein